jgi:hypothetical protein
MSFCDLCNALTFTNLYPPSIYHHGENLAALEQSGHSCQLCKLMHWSVSCANEIETSPQLHFEGAVPAMTAYGEHTERDQCSIKLQIVTEAWNEKLEKIETKEIRHIGIWMKSSYMVADITLVVEEGTGTGVSGLPSVDVAHRGRTWCKSLDCRQ